MIMRMCFLYLGHTQIVTHYFHISLPPEYNNLFVHLNYGIDDTFIKGTKYIIQEVINP